MIREERRKKRRRKRGLIIFSILLILIAASVLIVWKVFTVEEVVVDGNELYQDSQIITLVESDEYSWNSLYVYLKYKFFDQGEVPFVDSMEVTLDNPHTLRVKVYEKGVIGSLYITSIGQYAYFDKDGFVVETSSEAIKDVPVVSGVTCNEVVLYEQLPIEDELLKNLLNLTQALQKYELSPGQISYDADIDATLYFDGVDVMVGNDDYITQKITRLSVILPQLYGLSGTLHLESWTPDESDVIFDRDS
jgi:cell division protein FtsQ